MGIFLNSCCYVKLICIGPSTIQVRHDQCCCCCVFCFTCKVMSGWSVNLTTLFLGGLRPPKRLTSTPPVTDNCPSWISGRRNESMLPERVSNQGHLTYESGALPTAQRGSASTRPNKYIKIWLTLKNPAHLKYIKINSENKFSTLYFCIQIDKYFLAEYWVYITIIYVIIIQCSR